MQRFKLSQESYYSINVRKVANGIIINIQGQEYVFEGTAEEILQKIQNELPEIANLFEVGNASQNV